MPDNKSQIEKLKKRIAARNQKIENLVTVQKAKALNEADEVEMGKLAVERAKELADQQRRDETKVKITIGAGVLLLPSDVSSRTIRTFRSLLANRHRQFLDEWLSEHRKDITDLIAESSIQESHFVPVTITEPLPPAVSADPIGPILKEAISKVGEGAFGLIALEILAATKGEDKATLEAWYAELHRDQGAS